MIWANFLHFYQPYNQQDDILLRVVNECYRPLIKGFLDRPSSKVIVNINGALTKLLYEKGYTDVIDNFRILAEKGQIEFTGSAMYHAFLPLLPEKEIARQITINKQENEKYFGKVYSPKGFFPPEMAVSDSIVKVISDLGYSWLAAPEMAYANGTAKTDVVYEDAKTGIKILFRDKRVSSLILSAVLRRAEDLLKETQDIRSDTSYWFTVMDAETFGHHRIGHEKLLFEILESPEIKTVLSTDILQSKFKTEKVTLRPSTWTNSEQDFWLDQEKNKPTLARSFILWKDPENPIHAIQWEFVDFVLQKLNDFSDKTSLEWVAAREKMDKALASDQFWWASIKPWWSLEMVEDGAFQLKSVIKALFSNQPAAQQELTAAETYYRRILDQAFEWQRNGHIRKKHLEGSGTYLKEPFNKRTPAEWHNQMILEFEDEMNKAAKNQDFERAIKWRDAVLKIKAGTDIYDVLHVVDELWMARSIPSVKPFLNHKWSEFSDFAKSSFKEIKGQEDFDNEKSKKPVQK